MKKLTLGLVLALLLASVAITPAQEEPQRTDWWNDATWYLLFVRSFYDSDGDGIGDLRGVIEKLDYLNDGDSNTTDDLGITGIWLMPITEAASYHGYDTTDYYDIERDYGTLDDMRELIAEAEKRGIRIVMDLVINHTSSQHEWFKQSITPNSAYDSWYVWSDTNPNRPGPWGQTAWYRKLDRFYYAPFWSEMPDLNYNNPEVTDEMLSIAEFWLAEVGVHGFRLDAIKYVVEDEVNGVILQENAPANRQWLANFTAFTKRINPEAFIIGEIWDSTFTIERYIADNAVDSAFEFELAEALIGSAVGGNAKTALDRLSAVLRAYDGRFAPFLTNHDQARLQTRLNGNIPANKALASALLTLPGAPFIYYGEEIGMTGGKPDENIRRPMQWDSTPRTGGFTSGRAWQALGTGYESVNVATQADDPDALLSHYRALIQLRNTHSAFRRGETIIPTARPNAVYSVIRYDENGTFLVLINMRDRAVSDFSITSARHNFGTITQASVVFGTGEVTLPTQNAGGGIVDYAPKAELAPYETLIIQLHGE